MGTRGYNRRMGRKQGLVCSKGERQWNHSLYTPYCQLMLNISKLSSPFAGTGLSCETGAASTCFAMGIDASNQTA